MPATALLPSRNAVSLEAARRRRAAAESRRRCGAAPRSRAGESSWPLHAGLEAAGCGRRPGAGPQRERPGRRPGLEEQVGSRRTRARRGGVALPARGTGLPTPGVRRAEGPAAETCAVRDRRGEFGFQWF